jgi:hypothetical protein
MQHFGHPGSDELADAKANFVESLAVSFMLLKYDFELEISDSRK